MGFGVLEFLWQSFFYHQSTKTTKEIWVILPDEKINTFFVGFCVFVLLWHFFFFHHQNTKTTKVCKRYFLFDSNWGFLVGDNTNKRCRSSGRRKIRFTSGIFKFLPLAGLGGIAINLRVFLLIIIRFHLTLRLSSRRGIGWGTGLSTPFGRELRWETLTFYLKKN